MVVKRGRPPSESPKDYMLRVRLDKDTLKRLDECCKQKNKSRSEIVREGIQMMYDKIKK